jgi:hypothetical protein
VERYGCIAGYPDRTYQGKQAIARYEDKTSSLQVMVMVVHNMT